jgi:LemA protein
VIAVWAVVTFNRLTRLRQLSDNAWADIDVQLKRRHDLIPQVVAVVKGHAGYERQTLEALVAARGRALSAADQGPAARFREEGAVAGGLGRIFAVAEAYPELRAAASFAGLQRTLTDVEDTLQNARRYYNAVVRDWNTGIAQFPANLLTNTLGFKAREFFGIDDAAERAVPRVDTGASA